MQFEITIDKMPDNFNSQLEGKLFIFNYQTQNLRLLARVVVVCSNTKALFGVHV
ncbi:MAG: hypothetical protein GY782_09805 [Gammaproteobacteria bacterium]|nr:hypothetical protein [Gammaproteobacteria bacterium]